MDSKSQSKPLNGLEVLAEIDRFHGAVRAEMDHLPPSPAKEMMEVAFAALGPLLAGLTRDYPVMIQAFHNQCDVVKSKIETAKQNIAKAQENMAKLPSAEQIQKNITPAAPTLPAGLASQYTFEMKHRYLTVPIVEIQHVGEPAAWQDWSLPT